MTDSDIKLNYGLRKVGHSLTQARRARTREAKQPTSVLTGITGKAARGAVRSTLDGPLRRRQRR